MPAVEVVVPSDAWSRYSTLSTRYSRMQDSDSSFDAMWRRSQAADRTTEPRTSADDVPPPMTSPPRLDHRASFGLSSRRLGTFDAYMTACETMWGVIIFIKFGDLIQRGGLLLSLLVLLASATVQVLNALAVSAVASNGLHSGAYSLLVANLGPTWGATTTLLYYLGMSALATVEICGAVDALDLMLRTQAGTRDTLTRSEYLDTGVIGSLGLLALALLRGHNSHIVHSVGVLVVVVFGVTLAATLSGAVMQEYDQSAANIAANLMPPGGGLRSISYVDISYMMTFMYPCFAGIFQPVLAEVNKASQLRTPFVSIPRAAIGAVLTSAAVFSMILIAIASTAPPGRIAGEDFLLSTWPSKYVGLVGTIIVGVGSCISCLDVAPMILQAVAADGVVPGLQALGLHEVSGKHAEPQRATAFTFAIAVPFAWLGGIEAVALAAAALFLQMYLTMDVCCMLLAALHSPGWRPLWPKITPWQAGVAALLCLATLLLLQVSLAPWLLLASAALATAISWLQGGEEMGSGDAIAGLQYSIALQALHSLQEDPALSDVTGVERAPARWRPQLLCILPFADDSDECESVDHEAREVLALAHHLKEGRGLTVAACVAHAEKSGAVSERRVYTRAKCWLEAVAAECKLNAFTDVLVADDFGTGAGALISCVGVGALRPNAVLLSWCAGCSRRAGRASELVAALRRTITSEKAVLLLCTPMGGSGLAMRPIDAGEGSVGASRPGRAGGYIDVFWVVHDGALTFVLAHLLQMHERFKSSKLRVFMYTDDAHATPATRADEEAKLRRFLRRMMRINVVHIELHSSGLDESSADARNELMQARRLNGAMARRCSPLTRLVITNLVPPSARHVDAPEEYVALVEACAAGPRPVLLVHA